MLDIRFPIGLMFSIFGVIITIFGIATSGNEAMYMRSLNINVNLFSGICMLIFGLAFLLSSGPVRKILKKKEA